MKSDLFYLITHRPVDSLGTGWCVLNGFITYGLVDSEYGIITYGLPDLLHSVQALQFILFLA